MSIISLVVLSQGDGSCVVGVRVWPGCHSSQLLWPCGHSELNELAAVGKRRGGPKN
jgi:hypothetical protein